jgi:hypothetical protein
MKESLKRLFNLWQVPIIIIFILQNRWDCAHGRHTSSAPYGYCSACGEKVSLGRAVFCPDGLLIIFEERIM